MKRILIVDDREDSRYYLDTLLKNSGYEVIAAANGAEALQQARRQPPQLIVSDLLMPVMDGFSLLREWRADAQLQAVPFIVYTATYTDPKDEELALGLGADGFILKPAEPEELLARVREVLERPRDATRGRPAPVPGILRLPVAMPEEEETRVLQQYNEVLIHKLEDKMLQADQANKQLQRDIASRKEVEGQLRESERKYRELVEHANSIILRWTRDGKITFLNEFGLRFFGYTAAEIVGQSAMDTIVPVIESTGRDLKQLMERVTADPRSFEQNINENQCRDGRRVWIAWTNKTVLDEQGEIKEVLSIGTDITERKQLEEQFRQAQKLEAIGHLAGGVAHDFNNILTIIQGNASLLLDAAGLSLKDVELAKQIVEAAERAAGLTRQLLLFSRKQAMRPMLLNLNETVGNVTKLLQRMLGEDIALQSTYAPQLPLVRADTGMMEQVLLNLAVNARDAMPGGGRLQVATSVVTVSPEQAQANSAPNPGQYVCLSVSDTGCGIAPEHLPQIFDPFFTTKEVGKGTGLGLAIVYGIVKQHQGWVDVSSRMGEGTTFQIFLPAAKETQAGPKAAPANECAPRGTEVILVVEDDPAVRLLVVNLLQRCGYTVLLAATGVAALEVWAKHKAQVQLLLTDMIMPDGMTGRELALRLKQEQPGLKVIYTSGYSAEIVGKGHALFDGNDFLQKPFSPLLLAQTVRTCLDRGK
ncbi:MAG TPA: response regulator [Dongiaceae bacterium]|nr:response regulator [Dongiaceae bacterium]